MMYQTIKGKTDTHIDSPLSDDHVIPILVGVHDSYGAILEIMDKRFLSGMNRVVSSQSQYRTQGNNIEVDIP